MATVAELTATMPQRWRTPETDPGRTARRGAAAVRPGAAPGDEPGRRIAVAGLARRRDGVVTLFAEDQALFDVAESLAAEADRIVAAAGDPTRTVVAAGRVRPRLEAAVPAGVTVPAALAEPLRRVTLAAAASKHAAASGAGDLHHRDLAPVAALELTFAGFGGQQPRPGGDPRTGPGPVPGRARAAAAARTRRPRHRRWAGAEVR